MSLDINMTAWEASKALSDGKLTAKNLTESVFERIEAVDSKVEAFLHVMKESAMAVAARFDENSSAFANPLAGIPGALKDNICTVGAPTTCGSKILEGWAPPYNATVTERIHNAGAIIAGKANCDEFAMGSSTENSAYKNTHNPWDISRVPGGSSGGSAASVAASEVFWALGSDTGGSIRQPGAFCGVVGLKPTYGLVSRYGLVAYASSLDQIGPLTRDVRDCALVLNMIAGHDKRDSTSLPESAPDYTKSLVEDVSGLRIGVAKEFFAQGVAKDVADSVMGAVRLLESKGAKVVDVTLPNVEYALPCYYIIAPAEASSNLARYDGVRYGFRASGVHDHIEMFRKTRAQGFGAEVKQRIMIGTYTLSAGYYDAYYLKAQQVRTLLRADFDKAFTLCDVLLTPTAPTTAFKIGECADDPYQMKLSDVCTIPVNLAGLPGMSIPCGFSEGLPVGLQIIAPAFREDLIFQTAYTFEQATEYHKARPSL